LLVKEGGLGVRRVASHALSAYLASAVSTVALQDQILTHCLPSPGSHFRTYLTSWSALADSISLHLPSKQPSWDHPLVLMDQREVEEKLVDPFQRASFLTATAQHSGD
jgi:hypothetical protein